MMLFLLIKRYVNIKLYIDTTKFIFIIFTFMETFSLGTLKFSGFLAPNSLERISEASYAEHTTIGGKPRLQRTGDKLDEISLSIELHRSFCVPENIIAQIRDLKANGTINKFTTAAGDVLGDFIVTAITETSSKHLSDGSIWAISLTLTLKEWATRDGLTERANAARSNGFANSANNPPQATIQQTQAVEFQAMDDLNLIGAQSVAIDTSIGAMETNPAIEAHERQKLTNRLSDILNNASEARGIINAFGGQKYTDTRGLDTDLIAIINSASSMQSVVSSAPVSSLRTLATSLASLVSDMRRSGQLLAKYTATRS